MNHKAFEIAADLGKLLEGQPIRDIGIALGLVLGQFILLVERDGGGIDAGIQSIADDAKEAAKRLRNLRQ